MMSKAQSLQDQIRVKLFSIIGIFLLITSVLILALSVTSILIYQKRQLEQYQELVKTKIESDISSVLREANSLGTSPIVWTGLTDSAGRDAYLLPLLQRININSPHKVDLLDYKGRDFIVSDNYASGLRVDLPVVKKVVATDEIHTEFTQSENGQYLLIGLPIKAPFADSALGVLLINFDLTAAIDTLKLPEGIEVNINSSKYRPSDRFGVDQISSVLEIKGGDYIVPLSVNVSKSILDNFTGVIVGILIMCLGVIYVFMSLKKWSRTFSQNTTKRLNELVKAASNVAQGKDFVLSNKVRNDEIDEILLSIQDIFLKQKESNAKLLISSRVFETAGEAILITGVDGEILEVNTALLDITGYKRSELIGQPAGLLYRNSVLDGSDKTIAQSISQQGSWKGETFFTTRDRVAIPVILTISSLLDGEGKNLGNVAIFSDITAIKLAEAELKKLIYEDQLTKLPNYRAFFEYVSELTESQNPNPFILLFVDLDNFKDINDTYNHDQGDSAICQVANYLDRNLPDPHALFRRSGDEFIAIIHVADGLEITKSKLSTVLHSVTVELGVQTKNKIHSSFSSGAAIYPNNSKDIQDLLVYADTALQASKEGGRSRITWFDDSVKERLARRNLIEILLVQALVDNKITPHYQPEIDLRTGKITGFEALARWHDEKLGYISPAEFIPIAEQRGLIDRVTECMIKKVLHDLPKLISHFGDVKISFNSSPRLFIDNRIFKLLVDDRLGDQVDYSHLIMEVTESELMQIDCDITSQLDRIIKLGVQIAIDDFGKDFSSLSRLSTMPIQKLKIDSSFISDYENSGNTKIIESIVGLANSLNIKVTAEGVETMRQRQILLEIGCFTAQGYLYSKPLPIDDALSLPAMIVPRHIDL